jgi:hypothetical protein
LDAYLRAAFKLTYDCGHAVRLPGPVIPGVVADGGYIVCDEPEINWHGNHCSLFSWGIASDDTFEAKVAERYGCEVHEFDPTVSGSVGASSNELVHFHQIGAWSERTNLSIGPVDTIENLVREYWTWGTSLNLKIDIEGAEWQALPVVSDWLLERVDHLILEIHTALSPVVGQFMTPTVSMVETMERLREKFYLIHYHVNNCCNPTQIGPQEFIPGPIELSFIRKTLIPGVPTGPFHLHEELNGPNVVSSPPFTEAYNKVWGWENHHDRNWEAYDQSNFFSRFLEKMWLEKQERKQQDRRQTSSSAGLSTVEYVALRAADKKGF